MLRTAEQILYNCITNEKQTTPCDSLVSEIAALSAINEARRETIEECTKVAKSEWIRWGENMGHAVDKESILSLIKELK